jgi:MATE family multidrug resistance protein
MALVASVYLLFPEALVGLFEGNPDSARFEEIARIVPSLLVCVAIYSLADSVNFAFSFALRGAGDTRFVSLLTFALAWPIMVIPTFLVVYSGGNIYWAWGSATVYVIAMAACFTLRFRSGRWKTMRVIETKSVNENILA